MFCLLFNTNSHPLATVFPSMISHWLQNSGYQWNIPQIWNQRDDQRLLVIFWIMSNLKNLNVGSVLTCSIFWCLNLIWRNSLWLLFHIFLPLISFLLYQWLPSCVQYTFYISSHFSWILWIFLSLFSLLSSFGSFYGDILQLRNCLLNCIRSTDKLI